MRVNRVLLTAMVCTILMLAALTSLVKAGSLDIAVPTGFYLVDSAESVALYRKDYPGGSPDFVQVVDLYQGGQVRLMHGGITEHRVGEGIFGGPDPRINTRTLEHFWESATEQSSGTFCITNGQFFLMAESPTRLPFSLKADGQIISDGYERVDHQEERLMLEIWSNAADIRPFSRETLYGSSAPDILSGLTEDGRKSPAKSVPRTFLGVGDVDQRGTYQKIFIYNTRSARQSDAAGVLRDFGAEKVMMLDGGGSTQLICDGKSIIQSDRKIPQAVAVIAGSSDPVSNGLAEVFNQGLFNFDPGSEQDSSASPLQTAGPTGSLIDLKWILFTMLFVALVMVIGINRSKQQVY